MRRSAAFGYGILSYLISVGTMLYLVGFLGNFLVPKSIDSPPAGAFWPSFFVNLGLLALFGIQHSVMARPGFKKWWTQFVPEPVERSTYVLISSAVLVLLFWQWRPVSGTIWSVEGSYGQVLCWGLFAIGWLLVGIGSESIDSLELNGLRQVYAYLKGRDFAPPEFQTPGLYRYVRHPLMLGFLIAFWSTPHMTTGHLVFSITMTIYIFTRHRLRRMRVTSAVRG